MTRSISRSLVVVLRKLEAASAIVLACGLVAGVLVASASAHPAAGTHAGSKASILAKPKYGGTLTLACGPQSLDPTRIAFPCDVTVGQAIYDNLMMVDKGGDKPRGELAQSLTPNKNFTVWTMTLRKGISFSDGEPFNAQAVKFNMDRHMDPAVGSTAASSLQPVKAIKVLSKYKLQFILKFPWANLPYAFANTEVDSAGFIAAPKAVQQWGKDYSYHAVGVGPFVLKTFSTDNGSETVLVKNAHYWKGAKSVYLNQVNIKVVTSNAYQALQSGQLDLLPGSTDPATILAAKQNSNVNVVNVPVNAIISLAFSYKNPISRNLTFRQAVNAAIDRPAFVKAYEQGLGKPASGWGLFPPDSPWNTGVKYPDYNLAKAQALVKKYESETGHPLALEYTCHPNYRSWTTVIVSMLQAAGIQVSVNEVQGSEFVSDFFGGKFQVECWSMAAWLSPDFLPERFFTCSGSVNGMGYCSRKFDASVLAARRTDDFKKQRALWGKAERDLATNLPWAWLATQPTYEIAQNYVHGLPIEKPSTDRGRAVNVAQIWLSK